MYRLVKIWKCTNEACGKIVPDVIIWPFGSELPREPKIINAQHMAAADYLNHMMEKKRHKLPGTLC